MKLALLVLIAATTVSGRFILPDELTKALKAHGIPDSEISTWQCIVLLGSGYNTASLNPLFGTHGIFQISQRNWCSPPGTGCKMSCDSMRNDDINNDIECAKIIYAEANRTTGNGFTAWPTYNAFCRILKLK